MYSSWSWSSLAHPIPYLVQIFSISLSISTFSPKGSEKVLNGLRKGVKWTLILKNGCLEMITWV